MCAFRVWISFLLIAITLAIEVKPAPLVIPPSLYWDGDDGKWSSFFVEVGSPGQEIRLLPGTSAEASTIFWLIIPEGCVDVNPTLTNCAADRGGLFKSNHSTSWSTEGLINHADGAIYSLDTVEERYLGLDGNGSYGYDTVSLGLGQANLPTLSNQLIAGIWTDNYFLGVLPLSPLPFNFSFTEPKTSMLSQLKNESQIPSLSWGYTAGAYYQDATTSKFGSLVLGGYDASRLVSNSVSFSFGSDISRDLLLKMKSITYDSISSAPLMTSTINIFINSLVSDIWLPTDVCEAFAQAFNLTYNTQGNYYLVSEETHTVLLRQNPTYTFTFTNGNSTVDIKLPYAAFDLNLTSPIVGDTTRYFPIRRGQNETQYVLGRTFLQEAYVIADYERRNFSISQAAFPSTSVSSQIIAIKALGDDQLPGGGRGLSGGAIAGIVVAAVFVIAILLVVGLLIRRRKRRSQGQPVDSMNSTMLGNSELSGQSTSAYKEDSYSRGLAEKPFAQELGGQFDRAELDNHKSAMYGEYGPLSDHKVGHTHEMNSPAYRHELSGGTNIAELADSRKDAVELDAA